MNLHSPSESNTNSTQILLLVCLSYDWPFPHVYFAKNVANTIFPFNSWLSFQRLCRVDKYITETFFSVDNKHRILFVIKLSKGCKFMPQMHQNTFGGRTPPGPAGGACVLPQTP